MDAEIAASWCPPVRQLESIIRKHYLKMVAKAEAGKSRLE